jgi:hypothetical protein
MPASNKAPSSICSMYNANRLSFEILKILTSTLSQSNLFKEALNNLYLSNSNEVMGLISVWAVKVVLGKTVLKPNTDNKETAIIDKIFHLPSQMV